MSSLLLSSTSFLQWEITQTLQRLPRMPPGLFWETKIQLIDWRDSLLLLVDLSQSLFISQHFLRQLNLMKLNLSSLLAQSYNKEKSKYLRNGLRMTSWLLHLNLEIWSSNSILNLLSQFIWDQSLLILQRKLFKV